MQRPVSTLADGRARRHAPCGILRDSAALVFAALVCPAAHAVTLQFDYSFDSNGFFTVPERRNVLEAAGAFFSSLLTDTLSAITPGGENMFTATLFDPSTLQTQNVANLPVAEDTLIVFAGASDALGEDALGFGGPGGFSVGGTQTFVDNVLSRGQGSDAFSAGATEVAPWGGWLSFSTTAEWYFDSDVSTTEAFAGSDFYSVALHELGHVLGLGTAASWSTFVSGGLFVGANATAANGGPVPVADGHWLEGTMSQFAGLPQEAAMDPTLTVGTRKQFTALDIAALDDIGWDIAPPPPAATPVPVVPPGFALTGMLLCLGSAHRRLRSRAPAARGGRAGDTAAVIDS